MIDFTERKLHIQFTTTPQLKMQVKCWMEKLYQKGVISNCFSGHVFRHHFALAQYRGDYTDANRDVNKGGIYRLQKTLNLSSISITENI